MGNNLALTSTQSCVEPRSEKRASRAALYCYNYLAIGLTWLLIMQPRIARSARHPVPLHKQQSP
jgi:hypothetical protein